jgi:hypothetical protein
MARFGDIAFLTNEQHIQTNEQQIEAAAVR